MAAMVSTLSLSLLLLPTAAGGDDGPCSLRLALLCREETLQYVGLSSAHYDVNGSIAFSLVIVVHSRRAKAGMQ